MPYIAVYSHYGRARPGASAGSLPSIGTTVHWHSRAHRVEEQSGMYVVALIQRMHDDTTHVIGLVRLH